MQAATHSRPIIGDDRLGFPHSPSSGAMGRCDSESPASRWKAIDFCSVSLAHPESYRQPQILGLTFRGEYLERCRQVHSDRPTSGGDIRQNRALSTSRVILNQTSELTGIRPTQGRGFSSTTRPCFVRVSASCVCPPSPDPRLLSPARRPGSSSLSRVRPSAR